MTRVTYHPHVKGNYGNLNNSYALLRSQLLQCCPVGLTHICSLLLTGTYFEMQQMKPCQTGHTRVVVDVKGFLTFLVFPTIQKLTETSQFCRFIPLSSILTASIMYGTSKRFTTKPGVSYKETKLINH